MGTVALKSETVGAATPEAGPRTTGHLRLVGDTTTARDIIAASVRRKLDDSPMGQGESGRVEALPWLDAARRGALDLTPEARIAEAVAAFEVGAFLFFWGDEQIEDLDAALPLGEADSATFLRLIPLVGG